MALASINFGTLASLVFCGGLATVAPPSAPTQVYPHQIGTLGGLLFFGGFGATAVQAPFAASSGYLMASGDDAERWDI